MKSATAGLAGLAHCVGRVAVPVCANEAEEAVARVFEPETFVIPACVKAVAVAVAKMFEPEASWSGGMRRIPAYLLSALGSLNPMTVIVSSLA